MRSFKWMRNGSKTFENQELDLNYYYSLDLNKSSYFDCNYAKIAWSLSK